jgi:hypothetical protein
MSTKISYYKTFPHLPVFGAILLALCACGGRCGDETLREVPVTLPPTEADDARILGHLGFALSDFPNPVLMETYRSRVPRSFRLVVDQGIAHWSVCIESESTHAHDYMATGCSPTRPALGPVHRLHWSGISSWVSILRMQTLTREPDTLDRDMASSLEPLFENDRWTIVPTARTSLVELREMLSFLSARAQVSVSVPARHEDYDGTWLHLLPAELDLERMDHAAPGVLYWPPVEGAHVTETTEKLVFVLSLCHPDRNITWGAYIEQLPDFGQFPLPPMYALSDHECTLHSKAGNLQVR